ncbi:MAG: Gfo/Idh/MocA family oxidoreductase, partial [Bacillota bacterium]|nr:Gfo/Idh/MocA family oxidoreductase [Bacillota bacterium]
MSDWRNGKPVHFGLVGCGAVSSKFTEAFLRLPEAKLVAAADVVPAAAERVAGPFGARAYTDYRRLLEDPAVEAVIIATPSGLHARMAREALEAGKHVLVEKPLALSAQDAREVLRLAEAEGLCVGTVHPNRYYPTSRMVYEAVRSGRLGRLSHGVAAVRWNRNTAYYEDAPWRKDRGMDGGVLLNPAWHALDLLLWFMGPAVEACGMYATRIHDIEADDVVVASLRFESGALGVVEATTNVYPRNLEETISIFGESGTIVLGGSRIDALRVWRMEGEEEDRVLAQWGERTAPPHERWWAHGQVLRSFVEQIREGRPLGTNAEDAVLVLATAEAILSDAERREAR